MMRVKKKGDLYVHQDANWNVIGVSDLGGRVVERYAYSPYGQVTVFQETGFGDRDGDGDVDATDKGSVGSTCTGTVSGSCRILDLNFDGSYGVLDAFNFDSLPSGLQVRPGLPATKVNQPFAHQGLLFEPEIGSYQNRARQYDVRLRRFTRPDDISLGSNAVLLASPLPLPQAQYTGGLNVYHYNYSNPTTILDPTGNCPPDPECAAGPCSSDNCDMYLYNEPYYTICRNAGNDPWSQCVRSCLQQCTCSYPWCLRWGAAVQTGCHLGCWSGC